MSAKCATQNSNKSSELTQQRSSDKYVIIGTDQFIEQEKKREDIEPWVHDHLATFQSVVQ